MSIPGPLQVPGFAPLEQIPETRVLQRYDEEQAAKGNAEFALSALQTPTLTTLYEPGMPIRMVSALDPTALKSGEFSLLQNIRPDSDAIVARQPTTLFGGTATSFSPSLPNGSLARGAWSGNLNGTTYVVTAWFDGTAVRIYSSTDGHTFSELTQTAGAYGNTRMTDSSANCAFQSVTLQGTNNTFDRLIVQNGVANPLVINPLGTLNGSYCFPVQSVSPPTAYSSQTPTLVIGGQPWSMMGSFTAVNSGTHFVAAVPDSTGKASFTIGTGTVPGSDTAALKTGGFYFTSTTQLCMVVDYSAIGETYLASLSLRIWDLLTSSWVTVYDPSAGIGSPPVAVQLDTPLNGATSAVFAWNNANIAGYQVAGIQFGLPAAIAAPATSQVFNVYAAYPGGHIPWGSSLCVSYLNRGSHAESAGVALATNAVTPTFALAGMGPTYSGFLPESESLNYDLSVFISTSSQYTAGVDSVNVYISLPGSSSYAFNETMILATYSGGTWSTVPGGGNLYLNGGISINGLLTAPDAYATQLPIGSCMAAASGRSFVGSGSNYYFSEYGYPLRYRLILDVQDGVVRASSGGFVTLPNTDRCAAWAITGASALGTSSLFLFTNASTYNITGTDGTSLSTPVLLAQVGCSAPGSVSVYQDAIFFLDDNYQIRKFAYGQSQFYYYQNVNSYQLMQPIGKRVIDDQTRSIPHARIANAVGLAAYDRYYFAYSPSSSSTNTLMLVWDETIGSWVQDTPTVSTATSESLCATVVGGSKQVYCQSADLQCYNWEDTTSSTQVSAKITTRAINPGGFTNTFFGRVDFVGDVQSGQSLTITKTLMAGGRPYGTVASDTSHIDLSTNVSGGQVFRYDSKVLPDGTTGPAGQSALTCQFTFGPVSMVPGSRILAIVNEQSPANPAADAL